MFWENILLVFNLTVGRKAAKPYWIQWRPAYAIKKYNSLWTEYCIMFRNFPRFTKIIHKESNRNWYTYVLVRTTSIGFKLKIPLQEKFIGILKSYLWEIFDLFKDFKYKHIEQIIEKMFKKINVLYSVQYKVWMPMELNAYI